MSDSYTVAEAAQLLGVTPKRVRQMLAAGQLPAVPGETPVRLPAEPVHQERERRKASPSKPGPQPATQPLDPQLVLDLAREIATSVATDSVKLALDAAEPYRRQLEASRDRTEQALREALAEAEARALAAEARAAQAEARLGETAQQLEELQGRLEESRALAVSAAQIEPRKFWRRKGQKIN